MLKGKKISKRRSLALSLCIIMMFSFCNQSIIFAASGEGGVVVPVMEVKLDNIELNMLPGDKTTVKATVLPMDANDKTVAFSSMNPSIATVDSSTGLVNAVKLGETYIIATSADGNVMGSSKVVVSDSDLSEVKNANVTQGDGKLTVTWEDAIDKTISKVKIYSYDPTYNYDNLYATATFEASQNRGVKAYNFIGLTNGKTYNYIIRGVRADGTETLGVRVCGIPNSDSMLDGLQLIGVKADGTTTDIKLLQQFFNGEVSYTAIATNDIVKAKAIPHVKDPSNIRIIVNGDVVANDQVSPELALNAGASTNFGITVIKKDNSISRTYIPVIYRETATQAYLKDLKVSNSKTINTVFKPGSLNYTENFDYYTDKVVITPTAMEDADSIIKINGKLIESGIPAAVKIEEGKNNINVVVTSKSNASAKSTYQLVLTRDSSNLLKNLVGSTGTAVRAFDPNNSKYYIDVQNNIDEISLTPTAYSDGNTIAINGVSVQSGQASNKIKLKVGDNVINVRVNDTMIYTVYAYRLPLTDYLYVRDEGTTVAVRNKYINLIFDKTNSNLITMNKPGDRDVLGNGYGYFLANPTYTNDSDKAVAVTAGFNTSNTVYKIYSQDENKIDLSFSMNDNITGPLRYEVHYVINKLEPGMYNYMTCNYDSNVVLPGAKDWNVGQVRWSIRGDEHKFTNAQYASGVSKLISPHNVDGTSVSDTTWLLPDGNIHGKYDLVEYEDHKIYGMTGDEYGLWFIKAQDDYTNGMPTAQELAVHETNTTPIINWAPLATHYGRTLETATSDWKYMWGPMFVYLNDNKDAEARWKDASSIKDTQVKEWPYNFIDNPLYDLNSRGTVTGKINITEGAKAEGTTVILSNPKTNWEYQSSDYTYSAKADKNGNFTMDNVRAGTYRIYAYQTGIYTNYTAPETALIKANSKNDIGTFAWDTKTFGKKLWEIGVADRTPKEFLHGTSRIFGEYRRYPFDFPNGVDFTIGKSNEKTDWPYAQLPTKTFGTKDLLLAPLDDQPTVWKIRFNLDSIPTTNDGKLTIAIAGSRAASLRVLLNDTEIKNYPYGDIKGDDSSYVRSAYQGIYKLLEIPFDTSSLKVGENIVKLDSNRTMFNSSGTRITDVGSSIIYDAIKMEIKDR